MPQRLQRLGEAEDAPEILAACSAHGVRVTTVYPGRTATPMQEKVHAQEGAAYDADRWIDPASVATAVLTAIDLPRDAVITDLDETVTDVLRAIFDLHTGGAALALAHTVDQLAEVKAIVTKVTKPSGWVVLNGDERGKVTQFLAVPREAETCGPVVRDNRVLVAVQHPGETDDATADKPTSHWPDGGSSQPRPSVVAVWKKSGNIGS